MHEITAGPPTQGGPAVVVSSRHLTPSQKAAIALDVKDRLAEEYRERQLAGLKRGQFKPAEPRSPNIGGTGKEAAKEAAAMMNVSHGYVSDAERIRERSPETLEAVKRGEITYRLATENGTVTALQVDRK